MRLTFSRNVSGGGMEDVTDGCRLGVKRCGAVERTGVFGSAKDGRDVRGLGAGIVGTICA